MAVDLGIVDQSFHNLQKIVKLQKLGSQEGKALMVQKCPNSINDFQKNM